MSIFGKEFTEEDEGSHEGNSDVVSQGAHSIDGVFIHSCEDALACTGVLRDAGCYQGDGLGCIHYFSADGVGGAPSHIGNGRGFEGDYLSGQCLGLGVAIGTLQAGRCTGGDGVVELTLRCVDGFVGGRIVLLEEDFVVNRRVVLREISHGATHIPLATFPVQRQALGFQLSTAMHCPALQNILVGLHIGAGRQQSCYCQCGENGLLHAL